MDIPQVMIEHEVDHMISELEQRLQMQGMTSICTISFPVE